MKKATRLFGSLLSIDIKLEANAGQHSPCWLRMLHTILHTSRAPAAYSALLGAPTCIEATFETFQRIRRRLRFRFGLTETM